MTKLRGSHPPFAVKMSSGQAVETLIKNHSPTLGLTRSARQIPSTEHLTSSLVTSPVLEVSATNSLPFVLCHSTSGS